MRQALMPFFSEVDFGSFLVYATKGQTEDSKRINRVCLTVKNDGFLIGKDQSRHRAIPTVVGLLSSCVSDGALKGFFNDKPILVPMPRSAPVRPGGLIPAFRICEEMAKVGLGSETRSLLTRVTAVPKAAYAAAEDRPSIQQHIDSMRVESDLLSATVTTPMIVVDDFVTRGTSFVATVAMLRKAYPKTQIRAFAIVRVLSGTGVEISKPVDAYRGTIIARGKWGHRSP
jgi:hypothetical protein